MKINFLTKERIKLLVILALAVFLRVLKFGQIATFGFDSSRDLILTYKMLNYGEIIYRGPVFSVIWGFVSPIYYYLLYPFHILFRFSPYSSPIVTGALGIIAVIFCYLSAKRMGGEKAGIITALIFAVSFYVIFHGLIGLNPSVSPLFSIIFLWSLYEVILKQRANFMKWMGLSLAMLMALHPSGFFAVIPILVFWVLYRPKFKLRKYFLPAGIFFILGFLPYFIQEKKFQWWTFKQTLLYIHRADTSEIPLSVWQYFSNFIIAMSKNVGQLLTGSISTPGIVIGLSIILAITISAFAFYKIRTPLTFVALTIFLYIASFGLVVRFEDTEPKDTWIGAVFMPFVVLFLGLLITEIYKKRSKTFATFLVFGFLLLNLYKYWNFTPNTDSVLYQRELAQVLTIDSDGKNFDVYGINAEPVYYYMWYLATDENLREEYLSWIKWAKEKKQPLVYFITDSYELSQEKIDSINDKHHTTNYKVIYTSSLGKNIYRFE